jgi:hypothetical protein
MTKFRITPDGRIRGLWTDDVQLGELGCLHVRRASHVEYDENLQRWTVRPVHAPGRVLHSSCSRAAALTWEHAYFSPGGPGWNL